MSRLTVLITGATSGIGKHTAHHLQKKGHHVIGTGRNEKALAELRAAGIDAVVMDVTKDASVEAAKLEIDRLTKGHGVDVLVNNAGYGLWGPVEMLTDEDVRAQYETNVFGLLRVTKAFLPAMRARGRGRVVNVSSVGGRMTFPLGGIYNSTKYAVESISDALRMEVKQFGIEVSLVEPGYIKTEFTARTMEFGSKYAEDQSSPYHETMKRFLAAGDGAERVAVGPGSVARAIEAAATSWWPRARYVAPFYNAMGPAMMAMVPTFVTDWLMRRIAGLSRGRQALPASTTAPGAAIASH